MKAHFTVLIPLKTVSEANRRDHWAVKAKRVKKQREAVLLVLRSNGIPKLDYYSLFAVDVTLIRFAPRELDTDNLYSSFKHVIDGVADAFGIDDRDSRIRWHCLQRKAKEYGVGIEIEITPTMPILAPPRIETKLWSKLWSKHKCQPPVKPGAKLWIKCKDTLLAYKTMPKSSPFLAPAILIKKVKNKSNASTGKHQVMVYNKDGTVSPLKLPKSWGKFTFGKGKTMGGDASAVRTP